MSSSKPRAAIDRRQFLAGSAAALMLLMGAEEIRADPETDEPAPTGPPVGCGVIGLGLQGRALLASLAQQTGARILGVCDTYEPAHKRALEIAPKAVGYLDYRKLLAQNDISAVFVATPTHLHRQIVLDAVDAGKHVYCEAPIANTMEDARTIAAKGKGSAHIFQVGLQERANPQVAHVRKFVQTGVLNTVAQVRSQWHRRSAWRQMVPSPDREKALNWRLNKETSLGLIGEAGIHSVDKANWFLRGRPVSAMGMGAIRELDDGRDVYDTEQCIIEYPRHIHFSFDGTLVSSYDTAYDLYMGSDATVLIKDNRAWMFKEATSPLLGWEVYARKERYGDEEGIVLIADASKQLALGKKPGEEIAKPPADVQQEILNTAVEAFIQSIWGGKKPEAGALEGYQATAAVIQAVGAIRSGSRVPLQKEWFELA